MTNSSSIRQPFQNLLGLVLANLVLALIISFVFLEGYSRGVANFFLSFAWGFVVCFTQWIGHSYIHNKLDKKYSWQEHLVKRAVLNSLAIILYAVLAYLIASLVMMRIINGEFPENPVLWAIKSSYYAVLVSFGVSIIVVAIGFFRNWKRSLLEAEELKANMLKYKYESLQNQINPHFLFNSFNVLSDLVFEDQKKALKFINQMSQLFRYVLDSRDRELVSLNEEMEFVSSFSFLLQTRFEDKLTINVDLKPEEEELIVPMTMQLLIENCVKHNEISAVRPLTINVSRINNFIRVENNLQPKSAGAESKETGLSNIIQQFSYFTDRQIVIDKSKEFYSVEVPVIKSRG